ncbi:MAG: hypothetical protein ACM3UT_13860 [Chloroflexota bacterium]
MNKMRMKVGGNVLDKVNYEDIKGSPYLFPDFKPATIITYSDEAVKIPVRYDLYINEMEVKNEARIYSIAQPEIIKMIITDSIKFIYSGFTNSSGRDGPVNHSYFILRSDGKCRFLIKKEIRLQDPEKPKLYQDAKPAEFIFLKDFYYFKIGENDAVRISNKSDALAVLADKESQVGIFIKQNRINMNKVEDLQKLAEYYNSLDL